VEAALLYALGIPAELSELVRGSIATSITTELSKVTCEIDYNIDLLKCSRVQSGI
jgi:hypothetical protein